MDQSGTENVTGTAVTLNLGTECSTHWLDGDLFL